MDIDTNFATIRPERELLFYVTDCCSDVSATITIKNRSSWQRLLYRIQATTPDAYVVKPNSTGFVDVDGVLRLRVELLGGKHRTLEKDSFLVKVIQLDETLVQGDCTPVALWEQCMEASAALKASSIAGVFTRAAVAAQIPAGQTRNPILQQRLRCAVDCRLDQRMDGIEDRLQRRLDSVEDKLDEVRDEERKASAEGLLRNSGVIGDHANATSAMKPNSTVQLEHRQTMLERRVCKLAGLCLLLFITVVVVLFVTMIRRPSDVGDCICPHPQPKANTPASTEPTGNIDWLYGLWGARKDEGGANTNTTDKDK